jgi:hypothetical protein
MQADGHRPGSSFLTGVHRQRGTILVLLAYGLLAVVMTWPVAARLGTHLAGERSDLCVQQWAFQWVKQSITEGHNPFYTDLLFHPYGVSLVYHDIAWLNIAAWLPLQAIVGNHAAYSLVFISVFALNGFAMYLLAREWTGSPPAAFVGGLIYGFWPYTLSHYDHPNMVVVCWVPLALLYLRRTLEKGGKRDAALTGVFLALTGVARWNLLIMGGVVIGLYLLYKCLTDKTCRTRRTLALLMLIGLVAAALMAPLAAPVVLAQLTRAYPEDAFIDQQATAQTDLLAYVLPSRYHPLWGDAAFQLYKELSSGSRTRVPFLGYTAIVLALYGTVKRWRPARFWALAVLVYLVLALGPQLRVGNQLYPQVPMPYRLVGDLFFIRVLRRPHRFNLFVGLPMGMLAAWGMTALLRRRSFERRSALLAGVVGALILFEYCPIPYPTTRLTTPEWYRQLAQEAGHFAVLDLPMDPRHSDKWFMSYQITHGKPLVEGHVARLPREAFTFLDSTPFLKGLHQDNVMDPALVDVTHQLRPLAEADVRYVILHKPFSSPEQLAAWQDWLTFEPYHEDAELVVYRTDPHLGRDFTLAHEMTDDIGLIRAAFTPDEMVQTGSIQVDAWWGSSAPPGRDFDACLKLVNPQGQVAQSVCQPLCPTWPTSRWEANEVVRSSYALPVNPFLQAGTYTLTLTLADGTASAEMAAPAVLGTLEVKALPRTFTEPGPAHPLHARWGDAILLHGYDLQASADSLELTLYWQAERRMDASYKVFVHLIDLTTGTIVAQDDAVPRRWTYPTPWWERGEVVEDTVPLSLDGVLPGQYRLVVGLYDPEVGLRLPAYSADGERYPEDAAPLTTVQR